MSTELENKKPEVVAAPEKRGFFSSLFKGKAPQSAEDILKEEQIQSPWRTVLRTFASNRLSMIALFVLMGIVAISFIGPLLAPTKLEYNEVTQANLQPGFKFLDVPSEMKNGAKDISVGSTFSAGIDKDGKVNVWGISKTFSMPELKTIPKDIQETIKGKKFKKIAAGYDHIAAIMDDGSVIAWGNDRQMQTPVPAEFMSVTDAVDIQAGSAATIFTTSDGKIHFFGNSNLYDISEKKGKDIVKVAMTATSAIGLDKSGNVIYLGTQKTNLGNVPKFDGKVIDIAGGEGTFGAITDTGKLYVWGNITYRGENKAPDFGGAKPVKIEAGRYHYVLLMDNGKVLGVGDNTLGQLNGLDKITDAKDIYAGYFQNYAVTKSGNTEATGLKGYLLGTDEFGRDIFNRILNGGRLTLTIGSVAVIISTIIGMILGGISGYFGGSVDMFIQRFGEIISALPFLPTIIILNAVLGNKVGPTQRVYLIMVLLGILSWYGLCRLVRAQVLSLREQEFVTAARTLGIKEMDIVFKHIIPNTISIIIVSATLSFAGSLLTEATLSFLGFGVLPPQPTWGNMLFGANNATVIEKFWWRWVFTASVLSICVICINLIGTGLDDAINPKSQER